jgi:glycosyltransferase involved in cell wall biosynthesis
MKLGLVCPGGFDRGDRVIPALNELTRQLAARHEVHVFAAEGESGPGSYSRNGAEIHQLSDDRSRWAPRRPHLMERTVGAARRTLRLGLTVEKIGARRRFDLLHGFWAGTMGFLATLLARRLGIPAVISIGGGEVTWLPEIGYGGAGSRLARARLSFTLAMARAVTAGSLHASALLPRHARDRARIIPLGILPETFAAPLPRPSGPPFRLIQVADISRVKDHETTLRALRRIAQRVPDVSIDFVGEDARAGEMQRLAHDLGLAARVRFRGFVPQRDLPPLLRGAHLHVMSSRYESQGVSILEAAAASLPTVGTAVGILPMLAPDASVCVPPGDDAALSNRITALLLDEDRRLRMGEAARAWATAHDARWTARQFEDTYAAALSPRAPPSTGTSGTGAVKGSASSDRASG